MERHTLNGWRYLGDVLYTNHSSAEKLFHLFLFVPTKRIRMKPTYFEIEICFPPLVLGNYSKL